MSKVTKRDINKQIAIIQKAQKEFNRLITQYQRDIVAPRLRKYIGKCYKFYNSLVSSDPWWVYIKVLSVDVDNNSVSLIYTSLEETTYGEINVTENTRYLSYDDVLPFDDDYVEISTEEFEDAKDYIIASLNSKFAV